MADKTDVLTLTDRIALFNEVELNAGEAYAENRAAAIIRAAVRRIAERRSAMPSVDAALVEYCRAAIDLNDEITEMKWRDEEAADESLRRAERGMSDWAAGFDRYYDEEASLDAMRCEADYAAARRRSASCKQCGDEGYFAIDGMAGGYEYVVCGCPIGRGLTQSERNTVAAWTRAAIETAIR